MTTSPRQTIQQLQREASGGVKSVMDKFYTEIKNLTPVDTGRAKSQWKRYRDVNIGRGETQTVIANQVPYIQRLNEGSSKQAPDGIVEPAWERANKRGK
jgi:lipase chaperone LimK